MTNRHYDPTPPLPSEYREASTRAARPRDAATLIVVRYRETPEILMGRRAASHKFMPNKFVFPGGRLDVADQRLNLKTSLAPEVLNRLRKHTRATTTDQKLTGLALAAIRETFEETGLVIGKPVSTQLASKNTSWARYFSHSVAPPLEQLDFVARAITPTYRVRRFDTRFFMTDDESIYRNQDGFAKASGELEELCWIPLPQTRELDLPGVTRWVVDKVGHRITLNTRERHRHSTPFVQFVRGNTLEKLL